jgi:predicted methyltransferase
MTRAALVIAVAASATCLAAPIRPQHAPLFPPENLGLLEAPDRDAYQRPDQIMDALQIGENSVVADLGAGGGWFTVRLARRVAGKDGLVYAEDVQPPMLQAIQRRVKREELTNVRTVLGTQTDPKLPAGALDAVLIVDTYHEMEQPVPLLRNVAKAMKPTGLLGILNYKKDGGGPGPPIDERVDADRVIRDARAAGLVLKDKRDNLLRYQYLLTFAVAPK